MVNYAAVTKLRQAFKDQPQLALTHAQACRLWAFDPATCDRALEALIAEGLLVRVHDRYVQRQHRLAQVSPRPAKAHLATASRIQSPQATADDRVFLRPKPDRRSAQIQVAVDRRRDAQEKAAV